MTFFDNPIADMYGPYFLGFCAAVSAAILTISWWLLHRYDKTAAMDSLSLPADPDPHEIAYLRGGASELARVLIFELIHCGYLEIHDGEIGEGSESVASNPYAGHSSNILRAARAWIGDRRLASAELGATVASLADLIELRHAGTYRQRLESHKLLANDEEAGFHRWVVVAGGALLSGLALYKLEIAISKGHPDVLFLILLATFAGAFLSGIWCDAPRQSQRGRAYLESLELAFGQLRERVAMGSRFNDDSVLPRVVGFFGLPALSGSIFEADALALQHRSR